MSAEAAPRGAARIDRALERIRDEGRVGLMAHLVLGYPTLEASRHIVGAMSRAGVDLIEVQIPFSDPTADGPTITLACQRALERGVKVADGLRFVAEMSRQHSAAFIFMSYFNLLFNYRGGGEEGGTAAFAAAAAEAGASGLIVPDLPPEEAEGYPEACAEYGLYPISVISPNVGEDRLRAVGRVAGGFLYCTSRTGTTGREVEIQFEELGNFLGLAREICGLPLAVGFSISRREQIEALRGRAEVAVVGSHLIRVYDKHGLTGLERELRILAGRKD